METVHVILTGGNSIDETLHPLPIQHLASLTIGSHRVQVCPISLICQTRRGAFSAQTQSPYRIQAYEKLNVIVKKNDAQSIGM